MLNVTHSDRDGVLLLAMVLYPERLQLHCLLRHFASGSFRFRYTRFRPPPVCVGRHAESHTGRFP